MKLPKGKSKLDEEIERVIQRLSVIDPTDPKYLGAVENLKVLCEARGVKSHAKPSMDTILTIAANIGIVVLVLYFEKTGIVTTKVFSFLRGNKL